MAKILSQNTEILWYFHVWCDSKHCFLKLNFQVYVNSGLVRGGSGGSADPPKILEPVEKKLEIDILS